MAVIVDLPITVTEFFDILDNSGNKVEYSLLSSEPIKMNIERELDTSTAFPAVRKRLLLQVDVPPMGYVTYALRNREPNYVPHPETGSDRPLIARPNGILENEHLKVTINSNGTFSLYHKASGKTMNNLHYFTDAGEVGNNLESIQPQRNPIYTSIGSQVSIVLMETNSMRGVYRVVLTMTIPATANPNDRIREQVMLPISYWLTLEKGGKCLKIKTRVHNQARDHKLCVNFPTEIKTDWVAVESAFMVERRSIRWTESGDNAEPFFPYQPMQNFIDLSDGKLGLALLNKGLREYEVMDDPDRTIALTLIRTHRKYMTATEDMTPEELEKYTGSHCIGTMEYKYALYPHHDEWYDGEVLQQAYQHKIGLIAIQGVPMQGQLSSTDSFIKVNPADKVMISALKRSEDGQGVVLRIWNITAENQNIEITIGLPVKQAKILTSG